MQNPLLQNRLPILIRLHHAGITYSAICLAGRDGCSKVRRSFRLGDQFLDMGRSATNVIGNTLATAAIAKWEGEQVDLPELEAALAPKVA